MRAVRWRGWLRRRLLLRPRIDRVTAQGALFSPPRRSRDQRGGLDETPGDGHSK